MPPSRPHSETPRGWIIPIGGKLVDEEILDRFVVLCGGPTARIAIIPTASSEPDIGTFYERDFLRHGVAQAKSLHFERRSDCDDRDWLEWLGTATGIFIAGGNQLKLTATLGGTLAAKLMRQRNAAGVHVAGTSAGAAFLSEHMIAHGDEGATPRAGMVTMCAGLGLTNRVIVDQHFRQRDRLGRLLTALAYNPFAVGLGVDLSHFYLAKTEMQNAADAAALAGASALTLPNPDRITTAVNRAVDLLNTNKYNFNNKSFGVDRGKLCGTGEACVTFAENLDDITYMSEAAARSNPDKIRFIKVTTPSKPVSVIFASCSSSMATCASPSTSAARTASVALRRARSCSRSM